ncbi:hypothetical protein [Methanocaldococcus fervens]|uniref:Uncharacterized protein n=1 Tax=Methanocaldococcus fervens (strain DSM 4213 / JCM 15782 / AG86) TaxID=573064 RepID=C7P9N8_METFA|nr:hypothetical protein [Methanocaldococcus fervens]ACV25395.1 hypothetical protein Mefer_1592 [Methanocaldococcus fervens AG86]
MDVSSIFSLLQQHWFEILVVLAIAFFLRNLKWILIASVIFLALMHFGYLETIKELILSHIPINSHAIPLNLLNDLINNSTNSTVNETINITGG